MEFLNLAVVLRKLTSSRKLYKSNLLRYFAGMEEVNGSIWVGEVAFVNFRLFLPLSSSNLLGKFFFSISFRIYANIRFKISQRIYSRRLEGKRLPLWKCD